MLTFAMDVEALAAQGGSGCVAEARLLVDVLSNRNWFIDGREDKSFNPFLVAMCEYWAGILSLDFPLKFLLPDVVALLVDELLPAEGLVIIH